MKSDQISSEFDYILKLFVSGASPNSVRAMSNLQRILDTHIPGKYDLQIIDVHQDKVVAGQEHIVALPLLIRKYPYPEKRLIGDMSNDEKVIAGLGINDVADD